MSSLKLFLLLITCLILAACGQTAAPVVATTSTQARLNLNVELAHAAANSEQTIRYAELNSSGPLETSSEQMIAYKDGQFELLDAETVRSGMSLEPDLKIRAFQTGATPAEESALPGHLKLLQSERLWSLSKGAGVTVAVIDSGIDTAHSSFQNVLLDGYDFITDSNDLSDASGHGTAVAALVAGQGLGLAPEAKVLPLRVLNEHGEGSSFDLIQALLFAADLLPQQPNPHKADIITLSLGTTTYSRAVHEAVQHVAAAGVLLVAATGNAGADELAYPAAFEEVIAVGAGELKQDGWHKANYSNYGAGLELLAPLGGQAKTEWGQYSENGVLSALSGGGLAHVHGTSYAAPQIAGLIALLLASDLQPERVRSILKQSSSDIAAVGWDNASGYGVVNAAAALRLATLSARPQGPLTVQLLDPNSLQELSAHYTHMQDSVQLRAGDYRVSFLYEPKYDTELTLTSTVQYRASKPDLVNLEAGSSHTLTVTLNPLF